MDIELCGYTIQIDEEDYEWVRSQQWYLHVNEVGAIYFKTGKSIYLHRALLGCQQGDGQYADHKDRNTLNNRKTNLRIATASQSSANRDHPRGESGYIGVKRSGKKWRATVWWRGKELNLGSYNDPQIAAEVRDRRAKVLYGEFAVLNCSSN